MVCGGNIRARSLFLPVAGGKFEIHVTSWDACVQVDGAVPLLLMHGLSRTGRDFDALAAHLSSQGRACHCPDMIGRGLSSWAADPGADYTVGSYLEIAVEIADRLELAKFDWVGTSMGGGLGMLAASGPLRGRVRRLVVNDIGPELPDAAVGRILEYAQRQKVFATVSAAREYFRQAYGPFGCLSDEEWQNLTDTSVRRRADGKFLPHYDPRITGQLREAAAGEALWDQWRSLDCEVLVVRGENSDLLTVAILNRMLEELPATRHVQIAGCGHAPYLNTPEQFDLLSTFLG